jgi:hypothetical protein
MSSAQSYSIGQRVWRSLAAAVLLAGGVGGGWFWIGLIFTIEVCEDVAYVTAWAAPIGALVAFFVGLRVGAAASPRRRLRYSLLRLWLGFLVGAVAFSAALSVYFVAESRADQQNRPDRNLSSPSALPQAPLTPKS